MPNTPIDRRTIRTKKMIQKAFSELLIEKGFNDITITDLTKKADINRGTFYLHYTDKHDLLEKIENEIIEELQKRVSNINFLDTLDKVFINNPQAFMIEVFNFIKENSVYMRAILSPKGDPIFHDKLKKLIENKLFDENKTYNSEDMMAPKAYFISYVLSAHLGVIQKWLESGMEKSPQEMALFLSQMFFLGPLKVSGLKPTTKIYLKTK